ncbi:protocatechuate 3,4-dioxygenase subunit beta [Fodinicola feengrottensis]|uniref:Protocatechuate 3,4-dioxygenase subunit beta n=1 Tax=Fodinicola feengrottensis TaxID=435914 RepID=A0ABN2JAZ6_9ACTN
MADLSDLTEEVVRSFDTAGDRLRTVTQSLVRHLHSFIAEVDLTEAEWAYAIDFLTRTGHITDDKRQEFILLSDVLGASMATIKVNHPAGGKVTESTVLGPFFVSDSPDFVNGDDISQGAAGQPCYVSGVVRDEDGNLVPNAFMEVWQADEDGFYDVQYPGLDTAQGRGRLSAADDGRFWFWTVHPEAYPIPTDGPVGELLTAAGRHPMRPAHIHFKVDAAGFDTLITHVFAADSKYLDSDAVFGVKRSLITPFTMQNPGVAPDGKTMDVPYYLVTFDIVLARAS